MVTHKSDPTVWVLTGDRTGDRAQALTLARKITPFPVEKRLKYNRLYRLPNLFLGGTLASLPRNHRQQFQPPWPDIVISVGRRTVPVARWIHRRTRGHCLLIHVGRPWAPFDWFDLIVTTPQYALPPLPHILEIPFPLGKEPVTPPSKIDTVPDWGDGPILGLLIGGPSKPYYFGAAQAQQLIADACALAGQRQARIVAVTSPRTPDSAMKMIRAALRPDDYLHPWSADRYNPYEAVLARADLLMITSESASMISDAMAAQKPVILWPLPEDPTQVWPWRRWLKQVNRTRQRGINGVIARFYDRLVILGLGRWPRDLAQLHRNPVDPGHAFLWSRDMIWPSSFKPYQPEANLIAIQTRIDALLQQRSRIS